MTKKKSTEILVFDVESCFFDGQPLPVEFSPTRNANDEHDATISPGMHSDQPLVLDSDDADILNFVSGCKFLFLDVGSNRGTMALADWS